MERQKPYRISEFANELGVFRKSVELAIKDGRIRTFKLNEMKLTPPEEMVRVKAGG
jgi:hypothetical protein